MANLKLINDCGTPQYSCSSCYSCSSICGISLTSTKNRGCCWYFPKFTLSEIHKMTKSEEGLKILHKVLSLPEVKIYNYYIHAKGYFDEEGYNKFIASEEVQEEKYNKHDKTIFFRNCPFVKAGEGCMIPARYRSYVCNFFICDEVKEELIKNEEYYKYEREMESYSRWIAWENNSLEFMLQEKGINLIDNFDEVIEVLKELPLDEYEFAELKEIKF